MFLWYIYVSDNIKRTWFFIKVPDGTLKQKNILLLVTSLDVNLTKPIVITVVAVFLSFCSITGKHFTRLEGIK
jgi:hypothetical protein